MLDYDKLALSENRKVEYTEMPYKCPCCTTNPIQSHMETSCAKGTDQEQLHESSCCRLCIAKHYFTCKPPISKPEVPYWCEVHQQQGPQGGSVFPCSLKNSKKSPLFPTMFYKCSLKSNVEPFLISSKVVL